MGVGSAPECVSAVPWDWQGCKRCCISCHRRDFVGTAWAGKGRGKGKNGLQAYCQCKLSQPVTAAHKEVCVTASAPLQRQLQGALSLQTKEDALFSVRGSRGQVTAMNMLQGNESQRNKALSALPPCVGLQRAESGIISYAQILLKDTCKQCLPLLLHA